MEMELFPHADNAGFKLLDIKLQHCVKLIASIVADVLYAAVDRSWVLALGRQSWRAIFLSRLLSPLVTCVSCDTIHLIQASVLLLHPKWCTPASGSEYKTMRAAA